MLRGGTPPLPPAPLRSARFLFLNSSNMPNGARGWCFTINNYPRLLDWNLLSEDADYLVFQEEEGEETHTPHLQGYIKLKERHVFQWLQNKEPLFKQANFLVAKKGPAKNRKYCTKLRTRIGGPYEFGEIPTGQGHRTDLEKAYAALKTNSYAKVVLEYPEICIKFWRGLQEYKRVLSLPEEPNLYSIDQYKEPPVPLDKAVMIFGESGIGKTNFARAHFKNPLLVRNIEQLKDFDAAAHDGIVFDEMSFTHWPPPSRIILLDMEFGAPIHCRYSNAYIPARTKRIFVYNNHDCFIRDDETISDAQREAIERRLHIVYFGNKLY